MTSSVATSSGLLGLLNRTRPRRRWTKVYAEAAQEKRDKRGDRIKEAYELQRKYQMNRDEDLEEDLASLIIESNATSSIGACDESILTEKSCNFSEDDNKQKINSTSVMINIPPPADLLGWESQWGTQLLCYVCAAPALHDCVGCIKCNGIAHSQCLITFYSPQDLSIERCWLPKICPYCKDVIDQDRDVYERKLHRLRELKMRDLCATVIQRCIREFLQNRRRIRNLTNLILIQSIIRGKLERKRHHIRTRSKLRVLILRFRELPQLTYLEQNHVVMVLTINDTYKNTQVFRFDRSYESFRSEGILIPGINWFMSIILSICVREESGIYAVIGQAVIGMRDIIKRNVDQELTLTISPKITWIPEEVTAPLSYIRISNNSSSKMTLSKHFLNWTFVLHFCPQNPVTSMCTLASAPPLDILRRVEKNKKSTNHLSNSASGPTRNSRYWVCLHLLKLWFFQYYGDAIPRFVADVSDATAVLQRYAKGKQSSSISLQLGDGRAWVIDFSDKKEALLFEFALNESKKALKENASIFMRHEELSQPQSFGFNIHIY